MSQLIFNNFKYIKSRRLKVCSKVVAHAICASTSKPIFPLSLIRYANMFILTILKNDIQYRVFIYTKR